MSGHTKGPWRAEPYCEYGGYDCMTGAIRIGNAVLDGAMYGQDLNCQIEPEALRQMEADARLIAAAPELLEALEFVISAHGEQLEMAFQHARAAIAKARGTDANP